MFKVAGVHLEKILFFSWPNLCGDPRVLSPQNLNVLTKSGKKNVCNQFTILFAKLVCNYVTNMVYYVAYYRVRDATSVVFLAQESCKINIVYLEIFQ